MRQSGGILVQGLVSMGAKDAAAPVNLGQQVHAPVNFQAWHYIQTFFLIFPANGQILHLSIEMSNQGTDAMPIGGTFC